jgi:polysaccharide deacetylase 2 family uncharacterized protein YibQ
MEPVDYPDNDPGPYTLMADGQPPETVKKLEWILSRATGYFGLTNYLGSRSSPPTRPTTPSPAPRAAAAWPSSTTARRRAAAAASRGPRRAGDRRQALRPAIDQQLGALEAGALQRGQALGSGFAYPVTLEKVALWANAVEQRGYQLAPASALTARR